MNLAQYSVDAGVSLYHVPPIITNRGVQSQAKCVVAIQKGDAFLSISTTAMELPHATIRNEQSIWERAAEILGNLGCSAGVLELHGRFVPGFNLAPTYLLRYWPTVDELDGDLSMKKTGFAWRQTIHWRKMTSSVPVELLDLLIKMEPGEVLGHDVCGTLCIWTKETEERILRTRAREEAQHSLPVQERLAA